MDNLTIYESVRDVPESAKREIKAGKLKGFTDINPMWRIKMLTQTFGPCGVGWYAEITKQWTEEKEGVVCAFCNINLYVLIDDKFSKPIPGTGGSKLVSQTRNGPDVSDECYKMAYTDALGVAAKALGVGANVYWNEDAEQFERTKYADDMQTPSEKLKKRDQKKLADKIISVYGRENAQETLKRLSGHTSTSEVTYDEYGFLLELIDRDLERMEFSHDA